MAGRKENFGRGHTRFEEIPLDDTEAAWLHYAEIVGEENGCPRPMFNIEKYMKEGGLTKIEACQRFVREHLTQNFWFRWIQHHAQAAEREDLVEAMSNIADHVPEGFKEGIDFQKEFVPEKYVINGVRQGLAADINYLMVKKLANFMNNPEVEEFKKFKVMQNVANLIKNREDIQQLSNWVIREISDTEKNLK